MQQMLKRKNKQELLDKLVSNERDRFNKQLHITEF